MLIEEIKYDESGKIKTHEKYEYDENGNITRDYQEVLEQNSIEDIDKFTEDRLEKHKSRREGELRKKEEERQSRLLEELFNAKLRAFDIPEIKNSPISNYTSQNRWKPKFALTISQNLKEEYQD